MRVCFRADASVRIGSGHVMRCLTLAVEAHRRGGEAIFVCRELPGNLCAYLEGMGVTVCRLPFDTEIPPPAWGQSSANARLDGTTELDAVMTAEIVTKYSPDWLVVDHYGLDRAWEGMLRKAVRRVMVIDDLADRPHDCDILLDQNLRREPDKSYRDLVPAGCTLLVGPRYALLRREFAAARKTIGKRDGTVRRILVFFGSSDPSGETLKAIDALVRLDAGRPAVDVVVGMTNPAGELVRDICAALPGFTFHRQVSRISRLMAGADLSLGAGGSATWERCSLGLPCVTLVVADNQLEPTLAVAEAGGAVYAGQSGTVTSADLARIVRETAARPQLLAAMSRRAMEIMGGPESPPGTEIVLDIMESR